MAEKRRKKKKYSVKKVKAAIADSAGIKMEICSRLGCSRLTFDRYLEDIPAIAEAYQEELDNVGDMARGALFQAIQEVQPWAVMFFLDRKDPEYKRKTAYDIGADDNSVVFNVNFGKKNDN
jgi:hypothetical protein